ncbi:alcohol dehydrogenase 1-like, partial [Varanus komodoensis]|uniref:alcohol dehydrogenase 1-like n=1 Tax=Varanus komodoensis TaxID=61221 RepID=UPI001CF7C25A
DKVIPLCVPQCGECSCCLSPKANCCLKSTLYEPLQNLMPDKTSRFTCKGKQIYHFLWTSTFSEFTVIPEAAIARIDSDAPLDKVCLFGCGFSTGYGAAVKCAKWCSGQPSHRARMVCWINHQPGCSSILLPDHFQVLACLSVCLKQAAALASCHLGHGVCVLVGAPPAGSQLSISPNLLLTGRKLIGCLIGGWKLKEALPQLVSDYMNKKFNTDTLITHVLPFEKIDKGFELLCSGKSIRSILLF